MSEHNVQVTQALEPWPSDGTCRRCGGCPRDPRDGLCATCQDEAYEEVVERLRQIIEEEVYAISDDDRARVTLEGAGDAARRIAAWNHRTRAEPDLVEVPPLIERLEFASANRVCAAPGANGRLCGKCYRCLMRQAAKTLRAALTHADSRGE